MNTVILKMFILKILLKESVKLTMKGESSQRS